MRAYENIIKIMMGNSASKLKCMMLVIGGCGLSLEREAHKSVEVLDFSTKSESKCSLAIPARGPTAHLIGQEVWVIGGCKGPKEHLSEIQIATISNNSVSDFQVSDRYRLIKERSCHMSSYSQL